MTKPRRDHLVRTNQTESGATRWVNPGERTSTASNGARQNAQTVANAQTEQTSAEFSIRSIMDAYPHLDTFVYEDDRGITLSKVVVPKEQRGTGEGTKFMEDLVDYADMTGKRVMLTPSSDFGGTKSRLIKFYKGFGFVENKGKRKDYSLRETMYRDPQPSS